MASLQYDIMTWQDDMAGGHLERVDLSDGFGLPLLVLAQGGLGILRQISWVSLLQSHSLFMAVIKRIGITSGLPCLASASSFSFQRSVRKARSEESRAWESHRGHGDAYGDGHDDHEAECGELGDDHGDGCEGFVTFCAASSFLEESR